MVNLNQIENLKSNKKIKIVNLKPITNFINS